MSIQDLLIQEAERMKPIKYEMTYAPEAYRNTLMQDTVNYWSRRLAREQALKQDEILKEAISRVIGDDWKLEDIQHRMVLHTHMKKPGHETVLLDNVPILELLPVETTMGSGGYKTSRQYRFFGEDKRTTAP